MDNQSKEFKKLEKEWYKKLKDSGFEDIESLKRNDDYIYKGSSLSRNEIWSHNRGFRAQYYRFAGQFNYDHKFKDETDKLIWSLHSEGMSIRNIVKILKKREIKGSYKRFVHEKIQAMAKIMLQKKKAEEEDEYPED